MPIERNYPLFEISRSWKGASTLFQLWPGIKLWMTSLKNDWQMIKCELEIEWRGGNNALCPQMGRLWLRSQRNSHPLLGLLMLVPTTDGWYCSCGTSGAVAVGTGFTDNCPQMAGFG